jgi:hypothetical protein
MGLCNNFLFDFAFCVTFEVDERFFFFCNSRPILSDLCLYDWYWEKYEPPSRKSDRPSENLDANTLCGFPMFALFPYLIATTSRLSPRVQVEYR